MMYCLYRDAPTLIKRIVEPELRDGAEQIDHVGVRHAVNLIEIFVRIWSHFYQLFGQPLLES